MDVLILEPSEMAEIFADILRDEGLSCKITRSVLAADFTIAALGTPKVLVTERIIARTTDPNARKLDLTMDGEIFAAKLAQRSPGLGVVFVAGYGEIGLRLRPNQRVLAKPFAPEALVEAVRGFIPA